MRKKTIEQRLAYVGVAATARHFGCSREHLSRVLHGSRKPNAALVRRLARLGVTCTVDGTPFNPPSLKLRRTSQRTKGGK